MLVFYIETLHLLNRNLTIFVHVTIFLIFLTDQREVIESWKQHYDQQLTWVARRVWPEAHRFTTAENMLTSARLMKETNLFSHLEKLGMPSSAQEQQGGL